MSPVAILLVLVTLLANAFFVAFEFALVTSRRARLEQMADEGRASARVALDATRNLSQHIAGVQLGVTVASLALGAVGEPAIGHALESLTGSFLPSRVSSVLALVLSLLIVVFLHGVLGELVPKRLALSKAEKTLVLLATPMRLFVTLFGPVIRVLDALAGLVLRMIKVPKRDELAAIGSPAELLRVFEASRKHGIIEEPQMRLLEGAIEFRDRATSEVMTPASAIDAVPVTTTVEHLERRFVDSGRSRLPLFRRNLDDVVGFVHAKDLVALGGAERSQPVPTRLIRRLLVVRATRNLGDVLLAMQRSRVHVALVLDRDGRTEGLVSLEDVLESLVGQIADETDKPVESSIGRSGAGAEVGEGP